MCGIVMGAWTKVFFQFDLTEPFWNTGQQWILLGTTTKDTCSVWLNYDFQGSPKKFNKLLPGSKILACFMDQGTVDRFGARFGLGPDYVIDVAADADFLLKDLATAHGLPDPTVPTSSFPSYAAYATDWLNHPCAKGA